MNINLEYKSCVDSFDRFLVINRAAVSENARTHQVDQSLGLKRPIQRLMTNCRSTDPVVPFGNSPDRRKIWRTTHKVCYSQIKSGEFLRTVFSQFAE